MLTHRPLPRRTFGTGAPVEGSRLLPEEVAVALSFNGSTQAVMMATPADLVDFAYGFALTEGLARPDEIETVEIVETPKGIDVQIWVSPEAEARLARRRRTMAGPVGCGLCGIDSIDEAMRDLPPVESSYRISPAEVRAAIAALPSAQPLHDTTRAVHAAGLWSCGAFLAVREDVGRHNALDKLAGAWLKMNSVSKGAFASPPPEGAVVLTSRVSIDMVQKVAAMGQSVLIAVSAPTAHAVAMADAAGITLIALARPDRFEVFTHESRLTGGPAAGESHVA
ncbi:formate dehydrogenase accessory sulfurtransferase FdhD [bacterium]|nr:formate dehydrogenase accessory sulfurtransferase FdhD [bacterium]